MTSASEILKETNRLHVTWKDPNWAPHLNGGNIMEYFCQPTNPFYDGKCNNELLRMQHRSFDHLQSMTGTEYVLLHVQEPILFVIRKSERRSPTEVQPIAHYCVINGNVQQLPDLASIINCRLANASNSLSKAFHQFRQNVQFHRQSGSYRWRSCSAKTSRLINGELPADRGQDLPVESTNDDLPTTFQMQRLDFLLSSLEDRFVPASGSHRFDGIANSVGQPAVTSSSSSAS